MGSLTSRPKIPKPQPQIVYVPAPQPRILTRPQPKPESDPPVQTSSQPSNNTEGAGGNDQGNNGQTDKTLQESREDNLLKRERGRFGTVNTSFRGLLNLARSNDQGRKTLLGE